MKDPSYFSLFDPSLEHRALRDKTRSFIKKEVEPQARAFDRKEQFNLPLFRRLSEIGLLGLLIEPEFGGAGKDMISAVTAHEEIGSSDPGLGLACLAHSVLCAAPIAQNGSLSQKKRFLPKLCSGEWIGATAVSEPDCGTDVQAVKTFAVKKGGEYILNGRKMWITNGSLDEKGTPCDCCIVYVKAPEGTDGLSAFIVEKSFPGFSAGQKITGKLGMRASNTAELIFENCRVPESHRIGKEGEGFRLMLKSFAAERLTLAALSLGAARRSLEEMNRYSSKRQAFGKPIRSFGQVQKHIAQSYAEFQAARAFVYNAARDLSLAPSPLRDRLNCDGAKLIAAEAGKNIADRAIQVLGGPGYTGKYQAERFWRDAKLMEIGGGTTEALEKNISRGLHEKEPWL